MLFRLFWGSLGLVLGAFGGFLEAPFVYEQVRGGHPNFQNFFFYTFEPPSWPPRSPQEPQAAPRAPSWRGRWRHEATEEQNPCIFTCDRESGGLNHTYFTYDWHLGGCSSQMGGLNHTYFTCDGALGRFHAAVGWVIGPTWVE